MDSKEFLTALELVAKEKGIDKEIIFEAIEASLVSACKKHFGTSQNIKVDMNRETGSKMLYTENSCRNSRRSSAGNFCGNGKSAEP